MCWDVEILPVGPMETEPDDVFVRYVGLSDLEGCKVILRNEDADSSAGYALSIRLPYKDGIQLTLGFRGSHQEAPVSVAKNPTLYISAYSLTADPRSFFWERICAPSGGCAQWGIVKSKS